MSKSRTSVSLREKLAAEGHHRCSYCQTAGANTVIPSTVDHILPESKGGQTVLSNLCLACRRCNEFKGSSTHSEDPLTGETVPLFNPRTQVWPEHFAWSADST